MSSLTLNIARTDLITELTTKRTSLEVAYDATIKEAEDALTTEKASTTRWADWYTAVAEGIAEGKIGVKESGALVLLEGRQLPQKPTKTNVGYALGHLEYRVRDLKEHKQEALSSIDSQLRLLNLANDETIQVSAQDYQRLLDMSVTDRYALRY